MLDQRAGRLINMVTGTGGNLVGNTPGVESILEMPVALMVVIDALHH
jgi:hypothetical protein